MRPKYYHDTDSLCIHLSRRASADSREISEGVVLDCDSAGSLVGIDIDNAGVKVELQELVVSQMPFTSHAMTGSAAPARPDWGVVATQGACRDPSPGCPGSTTWSGAMARPYGASGCAGGPASTLRVDAIGRNG
jgi:uncharacterized protein YuzE